MRGFVRLFAITRSSCYQMFNERLITNVNMNNYILAILAMSE